MKTKSKNLAMAWQISLLTMLAAIIVMIPELAHAAPAPAPGNDTAVGNMLCNVVLWFTGNAGKGLATIAIIIIGVGALMGKVSWGMAIIVGLGISLIFGAAAMVTSLGAGGSGC